ncbi:hypothetical protein [Microbacterium sp. Se63.02b]|uniref:hypothetical protein n=1 Tax=Microbacterium sp. Se63.02b TaxID=2709304 RepID=UPI0016050C47|nr:hypothetical protein [Microbacterium sp. Se63.02b]QNA92874.1 hypothetical protein G4G29_11820 [Microbacterium sp. Se63.02b]
MTAPSRPHQGDEPPRTDGGDHGLPQRFASREHSPLDRARGAGLPRTSSSGCSAAWR